MNKVYINVKNFIDEHNLIKNGDRILLSLSAGKDSMAMFNILYALRNKYRFDIAIFHLNHMLRGNESDKDESFLIDLAKRYNIQIFSEKYNFSAAKAPGKSFEEYARGIRYQYLKKISQKNNYNKIATAHNINDNIETVLMRIFTGTGIFGLRGIDIINKNIIRPILCLSVKEIYAFLNENKIEWREDFSNKDNKYLRNYIRNILMPRINKQFPAADKSINRLSKLADENINLLESLLAEFYENIYEIKEGSVYFDYGMYINDYALFKYIISKALRERFNHNISQSILNEIYKNAKVDRSNLVLYQNKNLKIEKFHSNKTSRIRISPQSKKAVQSEWEYKINLINFSEFKIILNEICKPVIIKTTDYNFFEENKSKNNYIFVTIDGNVETCYIRNRRKGDRIKIESGSKKIKDVLIEKKLDNDTKNCIPLLILNSEVAAFMPGLIMDMQNRVSSDFRVNSNSKKILVICSDNI